MLDPRDPPDPDLTPTEFRKAMNDALEEEPTTRRFADAHQRLFQSVLPLQGVTKQVWKFLTLFRELLFTGLISKRCNKPGSALKEARKVFTNTDCFHQG